MIATIAGVRVLPALPAAVLRLLTAARDDAPEPALVDAIGADPAIAAAVLRLANSVYYRGPRAVDDLHAALGRVGIDAVIELALTTWLRRAVPADLSFLDETAASFWRHAVASGVIAERLAGHAGVPAPAGYAAGLLHDVGKLAIATITSSSRRRAIRWLREGETTLDVERRLVGGDHAEVGGELAVQWRLPRGLETALRWHHQPDHAPDATRPFADLAHAASNLARTLGFGSDLGGLQREVSATALARLDLDDATIERAAADCVARVDTLATALGEAA